MAHRIIKTPVIMTGKPVFRIDYKGNFTRESIKEIAMKRGRKLLETKPNLKMGVTLLYPDTGLWKGGKWLGANEEPDLYSYYIYDNNEKEDPERYKAFSIYLTEGKTKKGGEDKYNDCLYKCLQQVLQEDLKDYFKSAYHFKKYLKLKRNDKVDISLIPKIEKKLKKYKINVKGDHIYNSPIESNLSINIELIDGHYTLEKDDKKLVFRPIFYEKIPLVYNSATLEAYNPKEDKYITLTFDEIKTMRQDIKSPFILISHVEWYDKNKVKDKTLK
jgi:hypothetical protein